MSEYGDIADVAAKREGEFIGDALIQQQLKAGKHLGKESRSHCVQCDAPIPLARQRAIVGVHDCVDCRSLHERAAKGYVA